LENGWIDIAFVTAYLDDGQEVADKIKAVRAETQGSDNQARIFPGLLTYEPDDTTQFWSGEIVQQVNAAMFNAGVEQPLIPPVKGVALFVDYRFSHEAAQALGQGPFQEPARPYWGN
jgi:hypothetical protein